MSRPIIEIRGISKKYRLGQIGMTSLREDVERLGHWCRSRLRGGAATSSATSARDFWALRDISFAVQPGEVLGIIGRNGAGKSTLLKILSRITEPTSGEIRLRGRVGSLLEVGTGFHPELSGRDNIFLNGAILGMTRPEIARKFDEIVEFAEVGKFIDTPVKRYSSGMYVRLAFAIAAHLEPEILIVDEVLAVGDAQFQRKCLGKMSDVSRQDGRTILFVSHNMAAVTQLTKRAVVLKAGSVRFDGPTEQAIERYVEEAEMNLSREYIVSATPRRWPGRGDVRVDCLSFVREVPLFRHRDDITFDLTLSCRRPVSRLRLSTTVFASTGIAVGGSFSDEFAFSATAGSTHSIQVALPAPSLAPGHYHLDVAVGEGSFTSQRIEYDVVSDVLRFEVLPPQTDGGNLARWESGWGSYILPPLQCHPN